MDAPHPGDQQWPASSATGELLGELLGKLLGHEELYEQVMGLLRTGVTEAQVLRCLERPQDYLYDPQLDSLAYVLNQRAAESSRLRPDGALPGWASVLTLIEPADPLRAEGALIEVLEAARRAPESGTRHRGHQWFESGEWNPEPPATLARDGEGVALGQLRRRGTVRIGLLSTAWASEAQGIWSQWQAVESRRLRAGEWLDGDEQERARATVHHLNILSVQRQLALHHQWAQALEGRATGHWCSAHFHWEDLPEAGFHPAGCLIGQGVDTAAFTIAPVGEQLMVLPQWRAALVACESGATRQAPHTVAEFEPWMIEAGG